MVGNLQCLDQEQEVDINIFGDYNAGAASHLRINVLLCDKDKVDSNCEEIDVKKYF